MLRNRTAAIALVALALAVVVPADRRAGADDCIYVGTYEGVIVIDAQTLSVAGMIPTGVRGNIAVDHGQLLAYLNAVDRILIADLRTNAVAASIPLPSGVSVFQLVLSPDGRRLFGLGSNYLNETDVLVVVDLATRSVSIPAVDVTANSTPFGDITPDGEFLYITRQYYGLSVVDTTTFSIVTNVSGFPPETFAYSVSVAPNGLRAYTVDPENYVSVIDTTTNAIVKRIKIVDDCHTINDIPENCGTISLTISPDGQYLYVVDAIDESIDVIDTATNSEDPLGDIILGNPTVPGSAAHPVFGKVSSDGQTLAFTHSVHDRDLLHPNFIWVVWQRTPIKVTFSESPSPVYDDTALAIASVPSGCAGVPVTPSTTPTATETPTPTVTPPACVGGCDGTGPLTSAQLLTAVSIVLDEALLPDCPTIDVNRDDTITVEEVVRAARDFRRGCIPGDAR